MCTLTYLPYPDGGFGLVSSRDEMVSRGPMQAPQFKQEAGALYPLDAKSGGTWIASSEAGYSLNLMNGGLVKHEKQPPYRQSRGLVIKEFLAIGECHDFVDQFDFNGIEPFTLIIVHHQPREVCSIIWTGQEVIFDALDPDQPMIWSSSTLYSPEAKNRRQQWFQEALAGYEQQKNSSAVTPFEALLKFHDEGGADWPIAADRLRMNNEKGQQTVCISGVDYSPTNWRFYYHDLVADLERTVSLIG